MASGKCPFYEWIGWRSEDKCKATGNDIPSDIGKNLCDSANHESCPVYNAIAGKK